MIHPTNRPDVYQHLICVDTVKNPNKELLGGISYFEALQVLKTKFNYTDNDINKLESIK
jgi:hypothetical protein